MPQFGGVDTVRLLTTAMRVSSDEQKLIANNLANVDTPNYNPAHLDFQATLRQAIEGRDRFSLRRTHSRHLVGSRQSPTLEGLVFSSKNDYNKVDMDQEIANLSKNTGRYTLYGSLLVKQFQMMRSVLQNER